MGTQKLLLVPTEYESKILQKRLGSHVSLCTKVCGMGGVYAGIGTANLLAEHKYLEVCLAGIAGTFGEVPIGEACEFTRVHADDFGAGRGSDFQSWTDLGWANLSGQATTIQLTPENSELASDRTQLARFGKPPAGDLLSVCAVSGNQAHADCRRKMFPNAIAEDMEGFAVAVACRSAGIRLRIVRGMSNLIGDRDHGNWQVEKALESVANYLLEWWL